MTNGGLTPYLKSGGCAAAVLIDHTPWSWRAFTIEGAMTWYRGTERCEQALRGFRANY